MHVLTSTHSFHSQLNVEMGNKKLNPGNFGSVLSRSLSVPVKHTEAKPLVLQKTHN